MIFHRHPARYSEPPHIGPLIFSGLIMPRGSYLEPGLWPWWNKFPSWCCPRCKWLGPFKEHGTKSLWILNPAFLATTCAIYRCRWLNRLTTVRLIPCKVCIILTAFQCLINEAKSYRIWPFLCRLIWIVLLFFVLVLLQKLIPPYWWKPPYFICWYFS